MYPSTQFAPYFGGKVTSSGFQDNYADDTFPVSSHISIKPISAIIHNFFYCVTFFRVSDISCTYKIDKNF